MLVNFRVENFLSINEMTTFSMVAGKVKQHDDHLLNLSKNKNLLKFSALYGANASGKSSFVRAIKFAQRMIIRGFGNKEATIGNYNKNISSNKDRETKFEFEIFIKDKIYSYGFAMILSRKEFTKEWLYNITGKEIPIFVINKQIAEHSYINNKAVNLVDSELERLKIYVDDNIYDKHELLLSSLQGGKRTIKSKDGERIFESIFDWFKNRLEVLEAGDEAKGSIPSITSKGDDRYKADLSSYLDRNDTGVEDVILEHVDSLSGIHPREVEKIFEHLATLRVVSKKNDYVEIKSQVVVKTSKNIFLIQDTGENFNTFELKFKHKNGTLYSLAEESDGTVRLIELFSVLYKEEKDDKTFVIDEIDRSLHPLLTYNFIESFLNKKGRDQLIVTAHEDILLDLELLRRDEIWFVDKNEEGNSMLCSLEEFKERFDRNIQNAYHDGRYGGIPKLSNLFSILVD